MNSCDILQISVNTEIESEIITFQQAIAKAMEGNTAPAKVKIKDLSHFKQSLTQEKEEI